MIERPDDTQRTMEELQTRAEWAEDTEQALHDDVLDVLTVLADDDPALLDSHHDMTREFLRLTRLGCYAEAQQAMDAWFDKHFSEDKEG